MTPSKAPLPFLGMWKPTKYDTLSGITPSILKWRKMTKIALILVFLGERPIGADSHRAAQLS